MRRIAYIKFRLYVSVVSLRITSLCFILIPFTAIIDSDKKLICNIMISLVFWRSLLLSCTMLVLANNKLRSINKYVTVRRFLGKSKIGIISFCSTDMGKIFDAILILSLIAFLINIIILEDLNEIITYFIISILVFSLSMHCVFNGKIYKITKFKKQGDRIKNGKN